MQLRKNLLPISTGCLFVVLLSITVGVLFYYSPMYVDNLIINDISKLSSTFHKIDKDCVILNFEHAANYIDFLNVEKFSGPQVGPMILQYPNKWQGPYVPYNPRVQDKLYQIIQTNKGYYIVPGNGVKLSNEKVIGRDIIFNMDSDIEGMLLDKNALLSKGGPLAARVNVKFNNPKQLIVDNIAIEDANIGD